MNHKSNSELHNKCLICLKFDPTSMSINSNVENSNFNQITFKDMIEDFMSLKDLNEYYVPQCICLPCSDDLKTSYEFRKKCHQTEAYLIKFRLDLYDVDLKNEITELQSDETVKEQSEDATFDAENIKANDEKQKTIPFVCRKCEKCYLSYQDLQKHNAIHSKADCLSCRFCQKKFLHIRQYQPHILKEHSNELKWCCGYCDREEKNISSIEQHLSQHEPKLRDDDRLNPTKIDPKHSCKICQASFKSISLLKRHSSTHNPDKPFRCNHHNCKWSFINEEDLLQHVAVNHTAGDRHECIYCGKCFQQSRLLRQHMISHKRTKRFPCKFCPKAFNLLHHKQNHERIHTGEMNYLCAKCGKSFAVKDRLRTHLKTHSTGQAYECENCGKVFRTEKKLQDHLKEHNNDLQFMCSHCGLMFPSRISLTKHNTTMHKSQAAHICSICEYSFTTEKELNCHIKIHTYQYQCDICSKSFSLRSSLEKHIRIHSSDRGQHKCSICTSTFNRQEHLKQHILRQHTKVKPFKCNQCNKAFFQSGELNIHMRTHTGERPYKCEQCLKTFTRSHSLRFHIRTHTGEKPYKCAVCHKGHATLSGLTSHVKTHNKKLIKPRIENIDLKAIDFAFDIAPFVIESDDIINLLK